MRNARNRADYVLSNTLERQVQLSFSLDGGLRYCSEILRRSAASTMHATIRHVFLHLKDIDPIVPSPSPLDPDSEPAVDSADTLAVESSQEGEKSVQPKR